MWGGGKKPPKIQDMVFRGARIIQLKIFNIPQSLDYLYEIPCISHRFDKSTYWIQMFVVIGIKILHDSNVLGKMALSVLSR